MPSTTHNLFDDTSLSKFIDAYSFFVFFTPGHKPGGFFIF